jgi:O-antigen/teichoic acid export membrane protein
MKLDIPKFRITNLLNRSLVRGTFWMLISRGLRIVLQAAYFIIIARALGPDQYGAFIGVTALVSIVGPFVSWGYGDILIKNVSRDRSVFSEYWGNALLVILWSGLALLCLLLLAAPLLLPDTVTAQILVLIALSDLLYLRAMEVSGRSFIAVDQMNFAALIGTLTTLKSLIAAFCLVHFFPSPDLQLWAILYSLSTIIAAIISMLIVMVRLGRPRLALAQLKPDLLEGFFFSISLSSQTVYNDIDKTMLARLSTLGATGIYAAAYRLIDVAFVPVTSLSAAAYAKFFQRGVGGISSTLQFAQKLSLIGGLYGIAACVGLLICAPVVPLILGEEYAGAVEALRWLSPILFLRALQFFAADALTGAGFQGIRSGVQIGAALFNVLINLWMIPQFSWRGAAWTSLMTDGLLMVSLWFTVLFISRKQQFKTNA